MNTLKFLKRLAALGLLIAFFLPLSQCSTPEQNISKDPPTQSNQNAKVRQSDGIVFAARMDKDDALLTLTNGVAFFWPVLFTLLAFFRPEVEQSLSIRLSEILLCLGSAFILLRLTSFGTLLPGGYLGWSALGIYFAITLFNFIERIRRTWQVPA
ncbi:hypothetical protein [Undibacterium sp. Di24W]|uniref:hypothetical protein n=1 Tax=Undibacterium sp. Di24W TaxID=3413033 RepID=UPI003BEFEB7D